MSEQDPNYNPRQRLRELNDIRESDRTDEEWDELHEIEIQLAVCNHINNTATPERKQHKNKPQQQQQRHNKPAGNHHEHKKPQGANPGQGKMGNGGGKSRGPRKRPGKPGQPRNAEGGAPESAAAPSAPSPAPASE